MKSLHTLLLTVSAAAALTVFVSAQQRPSTSNQQQSQSMEQMQGMQGTQKGQTQPGHMDQMMQNCRKTMQPMMQANSQAKKDIDAAKASNDPAKMRSALDEAEKAIDGMNTHMSTCMSMMNVMQKQARHDGSGTMGEQQSKPQAESSPKQ